MREKSSYAIIISLFTGLIAGMLIVLALPSHTPYSMINGGPDGLSKLATTFVARPFKITVESPPGNANYSAIIIIGYGNVDNKVIDRIKNFAEQGGLVLASGDPYFLDKLLNYTGIKAKVDDYPIYDMVYNYQSRLNPIAYSPSCNTSIITKLPAPIETKEDTDILAITSNYSYADENGNGFMDLTDPWGSFIIAIKVEVGNGSIVVITSPQVFTNAFYMNNAKFFSCIINNRRLYIDQSLVVEGPLESLKLTFRYQPSLYVKIDVLIISIIAGVVSHEIVRRI